MSIDPALRALSISEEAFSTVTRAERDVQSVFDAVDARALRCQARVLSAFRDLRVEARHLFGSNGYGYDDLGRDTLDALYARSLGGESALVRPGIVSGTHALALCLYGVLRPRQTLLCVTGKPYDTLEETIGISGNPGQGSLAEWGVSYRQVELLPNGGIDGETVERVLREDSSIAMVYVQRSRGYAWRPALQVAQIGRLAERCHAIRPQVTVMVDNCYGEFIEDQEPTHLGADLMAGSLIKNPGGGIAPTGGYVCGRKDLVEKVAYRLTTPGIGAEVGSYAYGYQAYYQGLFLAPHVVAQSVKGAILAAKIYADLGMEVSPAWNAPRADIIQAIRLGDSEKLIRFCKAIQSASPVDSFVTPEPWDMPGYQHKVIMAAGAFVQGASIELSADAPLCPPYNVYMQGGLTYEHCKLALMMCLS